MISLETRTPQSDDKQMTIRWDVWLQRLLRRSLSSFPEEERCMLGQVGGPSWKNAMLSTSFNTFNSQIAMLVFHQFNAVLQTKLTIPWVFSSWISLDPLISNRWIPFCSVVPSRSMPRIRASLVSFQATDVGVSADGICKRLHSFSSYSLYLYELMIIHVKHMVFVNVTLMFLLCSTF